MKCLLHNPDNSSLNDTTAGIIILFLRFRSFSRVFDLVAARNNPDFYLLELAIETVVEEEPVGRLDVLAHGLLDQYSSFICDRQ